MRFLLPLFVCTINYSVCETPPDDKKIHVKAFPKKVHPGFRLYNLAGNYVKPLPTSDKDAPSKKEGYTTFPKPFRQEDKAHLFQMVPDSPYFTADLPQEEQRTRVKKMLIDLSPSVGRVKRSAVKVAAAPTSGIVHKKAAKKKASRNATKLNLKSPKRAAKPKTRTGNKTRSGSPKSNRTLVKKGRSKITRTKKGNHTANKKRVAAKLTAIRLKSSRITKQPKVPAAKQPKKAAPVKLKGKSKTNGTRAGKVSQAKGNRTRTGSARRLIAANDALIEQYPYTVSIQKDYQHWCAGALLNPRLAITTANCLWRSSSISRMHVRAGSRHTDRGGQVVKIQEVMKHPGWKLRRNPDNDIALMLLDQNVRFSHSVHGVDLPNRVMLPAFEDAWITSWGSERRDGIYDPQGRSLQVFHARFMDRDKCNNVTQRFGVTVTENFLCLAQTGRRAPCTRDTGAPAVSDGVIWGLASWGIRKLCGTERYPAVFSYVASQSNMDFITNATRLLMSEERFNPYPDRFPVIRASITSSTETPMRAEK